MLLYGQVPHTSNSNHLFWDLKDPVLVQTLHYRRKIIYQPLRIGFFHRLISVQDIGHMLQNRQYPFVIDLNKILPARIKAKKPDVKFSQHTYVSDP